MLMGFPLEGEQATSAEIMVEMQDVSEEYGAPSHQIRTFELPDSV